MEKGSAVRSNANLFCLCITACMLSAPLNGLSPGLSQVARDLGLNEKERDVYLGGYISLATMFGQMIGSCLAGIFTDCTSRKYILVSSMIAGGATTLCFGLTQYFPILLFLRVVTGSCQGAIVPVIFSLIGDFYAQDERATMSAIVSSCLGGGMMIGQLFCGFFLSLLGWRLPFIIIGFCTLAAAISLQMTLKDPVKGAAEDDLSSLLERGGKMRAMSTGTFFESMMVPTVLIMILQTIPNTIPWGVLSAHLHDFLATDAHLSMQKATALIGVFGFGAAIGGTGGGFLGAQLYNSHKFMLPLFMGAAMAVSALLMKELLTFDLNDAVNIQLACPVLIASGALAAVNGANIRVIVINMTTPEARGAAIAVLNFVNCLGRGIGPSLAEMYMSAAGVGRREAVVFFLNCWLLSGSILLLACLTVARDEDRMRLDLKKFASEQQQ